jgi:hypothetical protein
MNTDMKTNQERVGDSVLELVIAEALDTARVEFRTDFEGAVPEHLDFYLPKLDLFIEVKAAHTPRIAEQMARGKYVIVAQGVNAVVALARLIAVGRL